MEYEFTLKFALPANHEPIDKLIERLGAAGCDDSLVGIGQAGRIALEFTRDANSAKTAIFSALTAVKTAIPGAKLLEVTPDFVGLTDIADHVGVTRQNMRKLMLAHKEHFPLPVHEGSAALWHLAPVLAWLHERADYTIPSTLLDAAHMAMQINLTKEASQIETSVQKELVELVA
ncbi:MAG: DNA-binding protein [Pseudomonadota bacterium]|nr:DNA-binding protein [Pseudomonadota bacterium]